MSETAWLSTSIVVGASGLTRATSPLRKHAADDASNAALASSVNAF
jgi:hypothetical protein